MPSADFCLITLPGIMKGAFRLPDDRAHHSHLTHVRQTSPDKNVNCPCTTAAFTRLTDWRVYPASRTIGFCDVVPTHPEAKPSYAVSVRRLARLALRLPSDPPSRIRPCLRLVLLVASDMTGCPWFSCHGDSHPISSRPCWAYTRPMKPTPYSRGSSPR
jgi:hypothetical protein